MDSPNKIPTNTFSEVNLKVFVNQILERKWLFVISLPLCLALAYMYTKFATPIYEVNTSILIDASGQSRMLGESQYVDGGVGLIGTEKNVYNEIGILKSRSLVSLTLDELDFDVSYFATDNWYRKREHYGYFPFKVDLIDTSQQMYHAEFKVEILSKDEYQLSVVSDEFVIATPSMAAEREVKEEFTFTETFQFGEPVLHDYFHFTLHKPLYKMLPDEFEDQQLSFQVNSIQGLTNTYTSKLKVDQIDIQASILRLITEGPVLEKEVIFLKSLVSNFINSKYIERNEIAASKEAFIQSQLSSISDSLGRAERRLETFKKGAKAVDLTRSASNGLDQLQRLESDRGQIELNIKYYNSLIRYISESNGIDKIVAPSVVGINDPLLNENLLELKRLNSEKTRLQFFKGKKSYDLEIIDKQIKNTTNSLKENLSNLVKSSRLALTDKGQRIAKLEKRINQLPGNEKQLLNYQRKRTLYENLYNYLSQELAKTGIARAEDIADTRVLDEARLVGDGPISPQKTLIMLLAFILGLALPLAWIILSEAFKETINGVDQLGSYTSLPLIGQIGRAQQVHEHAVNPVSDWMVTESFRNIAAQLQFKVRDKEKNIIGISSMLSNEGKSFCATNLALSLAAEGKKVLLIDLNFRKPDLFKTSHQEEGILRYLGGNCALDEIIHKHKQWPSLHYITCGASVGHPNQLLNSPQLLTMLTAMKYEYDYLILDSPAVGLVSDYLLLTAHIDIHLFVLRRNQSKRSQLYDIEALKSEGVLEHLFLIFNDAHASGRQGTYAYPKPGEAKKKSLVSRYLEGMKRPA